MGKWVGEWCGMVWVSVWMGEWCGVGEWVVWCVCAWFGVGG